MFLGTHVRLSNSSRVCSKSIITSLSLAHLRYFRDDAQRYDAGLTGGIFTQQKSYACFVPTLLLYVCEPSQSYQFLLAMHIFTAYIHLNSGNLNLLECVKLYVEQVEQYFFISNPNLHISSFQKENYFM